MIVRRFDCMSDHVAIVNEMLRNLLAVRVVFVVNLIAEVVCN